MRIVLAHEQRKNKRFLKNTFAKKLLKECYTKADTLAKLFIAKYVSKNIALFFLFIHEKIFLFFF